MSIRRSWLMGVIALACANPPSPDALESEHLREQLVPTDRIPGNFVMRQQIEFRYGDESGSYEAVVQKYCDELTVIGFTPFGVPAFTIVQRGRQVSVDSHLPGPWPFPPHYVLFDVHRSYFVPSSATPPHNGKVDLRHGREIVQDRWSAGQLVERRFRGAEGDQQGEVIITYGEAPTRGGERGSLSLENQRYGYSLRITTLSRHDLTCP